MPIQIPFALRWPRGLVLWLCLALSLPAWAAPPNSPPAGVPSEISTDDLRGVVGALENDAERQKLISTLKALIVARDQAAVGQPRSTAPTTAQGNATEKAAQTDSTGALLIVGISERLRDVSASLTGAATILADFPSVLDWARRQILDPESRLAWLSICGKLVAVLGIALLAQWLVSYGLRRARIGVADRRVAAMWLRLALLVPRIAVDLVPIAAFAAAGDALLPFVKPDEIVGITAVAAVNATVVARSAITVASQALAPQGPTVDLLGIGDETAGYWREWTRRLVILAVYGYFAAGAALLLGLPTAGYEMATRTLGLVIAGLSAVLILQNRAAIARRIKGGSGTRGASGVRILRARLAEVWHVVAVIYVAAIYGVWALHIPGGFETVIQATLVSVVAILAARAFDGACEALLRRLFPISPDLHRRFPGLQRRADLYLSSLAQGLRVIVYLLAGLVLLQAWGFGSFAWITSEAGRRAVGAATTIAITALATLLAWEAISLAIEFYLARQASSTPAHQRRMRARTLLPLLHKVVAIMLIAMASLITLSELGVNIAPLLAGAGIVGIAIGFGAQNLVRDVITGMFILFEDTIAIGDVVTIGDSTGVVEAVSIRDLRLRGDRGALHTIPFSAVTKVVNMTKDFAYASFDIAIGYSEDIDAAIEAIEAVAKEFVEDRDWRDAVLGAFDPVGIANFIENGVVVHTQVKTLPGRQWGVEQTFNRRLKRRFDELGVSMYPSRKVYLSPEMQRAIRLAPASGPEARRGHSR
jgi:small-conductance mechanosensitive channel